MIIKLTLTREENLNYYKESVIDIDFEEYLIGVVASEIGNAPLEACKAQAVAARTFAYYKISHNKQLTDSSSTNQAFRVSRLISNSYPNAKQGVESTRGQVLFYNNKLIETCVYCNSNGGRLYSSQEVWGGVREYLIAKEDPYTLTKKSGHGIGLSQDGAIEMAKQNFNYQDILTFYYANIQIKGEYGMSESNATIVINWCLSKKGCGYVWGATGQKLTESSLNALYNRHPAEVDKNLCWKLWQGKIVYDCAGFVSEAMKQIGFKITAGASSAWNSTKWASKGTIDTLPKDKVCCLYRQSTKDPSKMQHTGVYFGDGTFMDSRGTKSGVIGPNVLSSYPWTHWAIPPQLLDSPIENIKQPEVIKVAYKAKVHVTHGSTVNFRKTMSTSGVILEKIPAGSIVDVTGTQGDWSAVIWDNKQGYIMSKFLEPENNESGSNVWYVRIECDNEEQAKALAAVLAKAKATT